MPKIRHGRHRSSRRAPPLKDSDFDHEISLVDRDDEGQTGSSQEPSPVRNQSTSNVTGTVVALGVGEDGASSTSTARRGRPGSAGQPVVKVDKPSPYTTPYEAPRPITDLQTALSKARRITTTHSAPTSEIDILYENQRGCFCCGIPLFSSKALGNLDPPAWTNHAHRPSPTDIHTAQVPDPSWEWDREWPTWRVYRRGENEEDEEGWMYACGFWSGFKWHRPRWWDSFVRRRAWVRRRVRKTGEMLDAVESNDPYRLNPDYFTVRPSSERARSRSRSHSRAGSRASSRLSVSTVGGPASIAPSADLEVIEHADELLEVLREGRIDREKIEAVHNYIANARDGLSGLPGIMHDIMGMFVFQASRRTLLTSLTEIYEGLMARLETEGDQESKERARYLGAAVKRADEEVRRLEYWSDVKGVADEGGSKGAADPQQGWSREWQGVDKSGPAAPAPPPKDDRPQEGEKEEGKDGKDRPKEGKQDSENCNGQEGS